MSRSSILIITALALILAGCATTDAPTPAPVPQGESRYLIDPRVGYAATPDESIDRRFETAWRHFQTGDLTQAKRRFADLRSRAPEYAPAALAEAAIDISEGRTENARAVIERLSLRNPDWTAARVYEGEVFLAAGNTRRAYDTYRSLEGRPDLPPVVSERILSLREKLFSELLNAARSAPEEEAIRLLRDAIDVSPTAAEGRLMLAGKLITARNFDEARRVIDPLVNSADVDRPEVQETLAEIEVGRGRFQEAIIRYERLARRTNEPRYTTRLEEIKSTWSAANMPPQFNAALESPGITRADFAVLLYWTVSSVRFAQNVGAPTIAIDINDDVPGREEIIRAIALGVYDVDPVTRRVSPGRLITISSLARLAARVLTLRGANCTRGIASDPPESRVTRILAACGIVDPSVGMLPDDPVSGRTAAALLERVERALK